MRFQGKFINEKGEEITRWGEFPDVNAFKEHLRLKGWRIVDCRQVGVAEPAFWEASSPSCKICSSCNEKNNPQFAECFSCKSPLVGATIIPEKAKEKSRSVQNTDSKSIIFVGAIILLIVVLLSVMSSFNQMRNDTARNMAALQNQIRAQNYALQQQTQQQQFQAQQQQLTNALVLGNSIQQQMNQ